MPAYIIADIDVHDPERYEEYKKLSTAAAAKYGAKFLVRGGPVDVLEGNWTPNRFIILEFPTLERARAWWDSEEYRLAKELRRETATSSMILVADQPG
jgi:uncharacterized protein (DUF1330 family)